MRIYPHTPILTLLQDDLSRLLLDDLAVLRPPVWLLKLPIELSSDLQSTGSDEG